MLSKVSSASVFGIDAHPVEVEVDIASRGLPHFSMVGLPDASVKESKDRVRAALKNTGFQFALKPITINLAPADLKKEGAAFDLPIALGILASEGVFGDTHPEGWIFVGELALDGKLRPVRGALSIAVLARSLNLGLVLPKENAEEAAVVSGVDVHAAKSLPEVIEFIRGDRPIPPVRIDVESALAADAVYEEDFIDVKGQEHVKRSLEVAASGGHNVLMIGPPGAGKTMLSRRLPGILPPMSFEEALETTKVHSVAGLLGNGRSILARRPFRSPHHTISDIALIGGGQIPKPGEVSLSHNGVLFLDELPEFKRPVLEVLRQPIEEGSVTVSRAQASITYPASFMLFAAMNPCPCGYYGDARHQCSCTSGKIHRYRTRISGPLMDRIDIHLDVPAVQYRELTSDRIGESTETIRGRVTECRTLQLERFKREKIYTNARMRTRHIKKYCLLQSDAESLLEEAMKKLGLSARAYSRILKLSRTIADMERSDKIESAHVSEAIQYRTLDRAVY